MTATNAQVRILMRERALGKTQEQSAAKANLQSRQTVAKYEALEEYPSERKQPRTYRTRVDVFAVDWPEIEEMLRSSPELEAKALFEWLCEQKGGNTKPGSCGRFKDGWRDGVDCTKVRSPRWTSSESQAKPSSWMARG